MCKDCKDIQENADTVIMQMMIRHSRIETALEDLFQACSRLCLDDMQKLEAEISEASAALGAAQQRVQADGATIPQPPYCPGCSGQTVYHTCGKSPRR